MIGLLLMLGGGVLIVSMFSVFNGMQTSTAPVAWGGGCVVVGVALQLLFGRRRRRV